MTSGVTSAAEDGDIKDFQATPLPCESPAVPEANLSTISRHVGVLSTKSLNGIIAIDTVKVHHRSEVKWRTTCTSGFKFALFAAVAEGFAGG